MISNLYVKLTLYVAGAVVVLALLWQPVKGIIHRIEAERDGALQALNLERATVTALEDRVKDERSTCSERLARKEKLVRDLQAICNISTTATTTSTPGKEAADEHTPSALRADEP